MAVRHYTLRLSAVGPVHIGNGRMLGKKDYFSYGKSIAVLDVAAFIDRLDAHQLERYTDFLADSSPRSNLQDLLDEDRRLRSIAESSVAYLVSSRLGKSRRGAYQYHDVAEFQKDELGRPYIPGSSVKGMLRTAILVSLLGEQRDRYRKMLDLRALKGGTKRDYANACREIEQAAFRRDGCGAGRKSATGDILRYIGVSDSRPLDPSCLVFAKKYDRFSKADNGRHKKDLGKVSNDEYWEGNSLDVYRECIKPGTVVECSLDIDERIDEFIGVLDAARLRDILSHANDFYEERFLGSFELGELNASGNKTNASGDNQCRYVYEGGPFAGRRCTNRAVEGTGYCNTHKNKASEGEHGASGGVPCYLGGGVGFTNKTVIHALLSDQVERVEATAQILFDQFPTRIDRNRHEGLWREVEKAGFAPRPMSSKYSGGRLIKAKDDHRHWKDQRLGASPHTLKLAVVDGAKYLMGKCEIRIES